MVYMLTYYVQLKSERESRYGATSRSHKWSYGDYFMVFMEI